MRARFLAHTFGLVIYPPRARGDRVRAFTAPLGPWTAAPRFENGGRRHLHRLKNHRGLDLVESSRSGALVAPRGAFLDCKRLWRVSRRGSRSNGGEFALDGAAGAAVSLGNGFACSVSLMRVTLGRARSEERGGCIAPPNATNFGEKVERVLLDSLASVASAPGVGAAHATPSRARRTRSPCFQEASPTFS